MTADLAVPEPVPTFAVIDPRRQQETVMFKGGLLWLIGIPIPIILILYLMGWLS